MSEDRQNYVQHMNVLFGALERFDVRELAGQCTDEWYNQTLCQVNDSVVRLGILCGEYHWHKHDREDELFFTLDGKLLVDIAGDDTDETGEPGETVELGPLQGYVVPKGVVHRTRAPEKTVVLMVETSEIDPIGDE